MRSGREFIVVSLRLCRFGTVNGNLEFLSTVHAGGHGLMVVMWGLPIMISDCGLTGEGSDSVAGGRASNGASSCSMRPGSGKGRDQQSGKRKDTRKYRGKDLYPAWSL